MVLTAQCHIRFFSGRIVSHRDRSVSVDNSPSHHKPAIQFPKKPFGEVPLQPPSDRSPIPLAGDAARTTLYRYRYQTITPVIPAYTRPLTQLLRRITVLFTPKQALVPDSFLFNGMARRQIAATELHLYVASRNFTRE